MVMRKQRRERAEWRKASPRVEESAPELGFIWRMGWVEEVGKDVKTPGKEEARVSKLDSRCCIEVWVLPCCHHRP